MQSILFPIRPRLGSAPDTDEPAAKEAARKKKRRTVRVVPRVRKMGMAPPDLEVR